MPYWSAIASIGGSLVSGAMGGHAQSGANRMNLQIWREQRDWQTAMANSEVQRRVTDMKAAGINPLMSVMGMGSASTPNTPMPTMEPVDAPAKGVGRAVASALAAAATKKQLDNIDADTTLKTSSAANLEAQTANLRTAKENINLEYSRIAADIERIKSETDLNKFDREKLQPLRAAYQEFVNKQTAAGVAPAQAEGQFWQFMMDKGGVTGRALMYLKQLFGR